MFKKEADKDGKIMYTETGPKDTISLVKASEIESESSKRLEELFNDSNTVINRTSGLPDGSDIEKLSAAVPQNAYLLLSFDFMALRPLDTQKVKVPDQTTKDNVIGLSLAVHEYVKKTKKPLAKVTKPKKN